MDNKSTNFTMRVTNIQKIILRLMADGNRKSITSYLLDLMRKDILNLLGYPEDMFIDDFSLLDELVKYINENDSMNLSEYDLNALLGEWYSCQSN